VHGLGIPDSQIILMLAEDIPCNERNYYKGQVFNNARKNLELYGDDVEVDYRGKEVTVENFLRVLSGKHPPGKLQFGAKVDLWRIPYSDFIVGTPASKRLDTDQSSNIFIYITGHGGDEFIKLQDMEILSSMDIADAFEQMHARKRYKEILFAVDTCQANTLFSQFRSPGIMAIGSAEKGENSYSHHGDRKFLGVTVIDRFTYYTLEFLESNKEKLKQDIRSLSLKDLLLYYNPAKLRSHVGWNSTLSRPIDQVPVTDFFGSFLEVIPGTVPVKLPSNRKSTIELTDEPKGATSGHSMHQDSNILESLYVHNPVF